MRMIADPVHNADIAHVRIRCIYLAERLVVDSLQDGAVVLGTVCALQGALQPSLNSLTYILGTAPCSVKGRQKYKACLGFWQPLCCEISLSLTLAGEPCS